MIYRSWILTEQVEEGKGTCLTISACDEEGTVLCSASAVVNGNREALDEYAKQLKVRCVQENPELFCEPEEPEAERLGQEDIPE